MPHTAKRVCILSPYSADQHRATGQSDCRNHAHCRLETAVALVERGEASWTNRNHTGMRMIEARKWAPRPSAGFSVLQLVSD